MKKFFFCIIPVCLLSSLYSTINAQRRSATIEVNPEYTNWAGQKKVMYTDEGHALGEIPLPVKINVELPVSLKTKLIQREAAPASFDLRNTGNITSVKNQGDCGSCWTFATMAAVESRWLTDGSGSYDLSEDNLNTCHPPFVWAPCDGGNTFISSAYLMRGSGPLSEADDPYSDSHTSVDCPAGFFPQGLVTSAWFLPTSDAELIKNYIMQYGALATNMYYTSSSYNSADYTYYYSGTAGTTNHGVTLAGWDDSKVTAGGTGAWIIKNSWGTTWGDNGYFYIAYQDVEVNSTVTAFQNYTDYIADSEVSTYSESGWSGYMFGYGSNSADALVKFIADGDVLLTRVGTVAGIPGAIVTIDIYDNFDGSSSLTGLLGSIPAQTCTYTGYHSFELSAPVNIADGNDYYIRVRYETPGYTYPIPIEIVISGFCTPAIASGIFWSKSTSGTTWNSEDGYGNDPCVYAYTQPATEAEINVKANDEIISDGSSFDFLTHDIGTNTDITFTIENLGGSNLILTGSPIITISGADAGQFSVQQQPTSPVAPYGNSTFIIRYTPASAGAKVANISIASNDADENPYDITLYGTCECIPMTDRNTLIVLYNSTNGDSWDDNTNWKEPPLYTDGFSMPGTEHTWAGVEIWLWEGYYVRRLRMDNNNMNGIIPAEIGNFTRLKGLDLYGNNLNCNIPPEIGELDSLTSLNLMLNGHTGTIPVEICNLSQLDALYLAGNQLSGNIPSEIGNLINLSILYLIDNNFSGNIPPEIGNLKNLRQFELSNNQFTGSIPPELGNLTNMTTFRLYNNQFTGNIPSEIGNLVNLRYLNIFNNLFDGLPSLITLINLNYLNIESNKFTFEDIESNIGVPKILFTYSPQDSVGIKQQISLYKGDNDTLFVCVGGENNNYQWYKDGIQIPDAENDTLLIINASLTDAGVYECQITNDIATELTLYSRPITVELAPIPLEIISPNGGEDWQAGSVQNITWTSIGTSGNVHIEYSTDNGSSWTDIIASTTDNGSYSWNVPEEPSENCLVRITDTDGDPSDVSDAVFTISANTINQSITFGSGWSIFSLAVTPEYINMDSVVKPLADAGTLIKVQDEAGGAIEYVFPVGWVNTIGDWTLTEGYKIKLNAATSLDVTGTTIPLPAEIPVQTGWNIIGYPAMEAQPAQDVLSELMADDHLIKAQDEAGNAIEYVFPIGWVDDIINFAPGEGYKVKVNTNDTIDVKEPASLKSTHSANRTVLSTAHFNPVYEGYGLDHMNVYLTSAQLNGKPLEPGDEIGLFDGEHCVGAGVVSANGLPCLSLTASKDDPETGEKDGFTAGNPIQIKIWSSLFDSEIHVNRPAFLEGYSSIFDPMATTVASLNVTATGLPGGTRLATGLGNNYPNPFNEETTLEFTLGEMSTVDISIYNLLGEKVRTLVHQSYESGAWTTAWDATDHGATRVPAGLYICRMIAGDHVSVKAMEVIR